MSPEGQNCLWLRTICTMDKIETSLIHKPMYGLKLPIQLCLILHPPLSSNYIPSFVHLYTYLPLFMLLPPCRIHPYPSFLEQEITQVTIIALALQNLISCLWGADCSLARTSIWVETAFQNKNQIKPNQTSTHQTVLQGGNIFT